MLPVNARQFIDYVQLRMYMIPSDIALCFQEDFQVRVRDYIEGVASDDLVELVETTVEDLPAHVYDYEKATPWHYAWTGTEISSPWIKATDAERAAHDAKFKSELRYQWPNRRVVCTD